MTATDVDPRRTATWSGTRGGTTARSQSTPATGIWTYTLDNTRTATQALKAGERVEERFLTTVTDDEGATATREVVVIVTGSNDGPVISSTAAAASGSVREAGLVDGGNASDAGVASVNGQLRATDVDQGATATWSGIAAGTFGSFAIDAGTGRWTYTLDNNSPATNALAAGETRTETFLATVTDDRGATATQEVTITVTGTNDAPTITSTEADATGLVKEAGVADGANLSDAGTPSAAGRLSAADVDHGATATWSGNRDGAFGTFAIDPATGAWTYVLDNARAATQALAAGQTRIETFLATVTDDHGATATQRVTITVTGTNDAPVAVADTGAAVEGALPVTGSVATNDGDVDAGAVLTYRLDRAVAGLTLAADGSYSFDPDNEAYDNLARGERLTVLAYYTVTDQFGASSTATLTIELTGTNDAPYAVADRIDLPEDTSVSGSVATNDGDVDHGALLTWALTAPVDGLTLASDGSYTFDAGDAAYQALAEGETRTILATYRVTDEHRGFAFGTLVIVVTGTNDAPAVTSAASSAVGTVVEAGNVDDGTVVSGTPSVTGQLTSSDVDHFATATWSGSRNGTYGTFAIGVTGAWTYQLDDARAETQALAEGETFTETFLATVTDDKGGTATQLVTVTIVGTNDAPVVSSTLSAAQGNAIEAGVVDGGNMPFAGSNASGQLTSSDPDRGATATWSGSQDGTYGSFAIDRDGAWTYTVGNARTATQALAKGQTVIETFIATVTDDHGAIATQVVTITLTGTNDAPVITSDAAAAQGIVVEAGNTDPGAIVPGTPSVTGTLTASDIDAGATRRWSGNSAGVYGTFAIDPATGMWRYMLDNERAATQALAEGQSVTETFTAIVTDEHGATATQIVTVTVIGTNDSPVVASTAAAASGLVVEAGNLDDGTIASGIRIATGVLTASDVDAGATASWSGSRNGTFGSFTIGTDGRWTYTLDNARAVTQALGEGESAIERFITTVTDDRGAIATQEVIVTITGTNDAPVLMADVAPPAQLITNGGFDNLFAGWTTTTTQTSPYTASFNDGRNLVTVNNAQGAATWFVRNVSAGVASPITGNTAFNGFDGSGGNFVLSQQFTLSGAPIGSALLAFDFAAYGSYSGTARTLDVLITNSSGATVGTIYSYTLAFQTSWSTQHVERDVSALLNGLGAGTFTLTFRETVPSNYTGPGAYGIDNISLLTSGGHTVNERAGLTGSVLLDTSSATLAFTDADVNDTHTVSIGATPTVTWSRTDTVPAATLAALARAATATLTDSTGTGTGSVLIVFASSDSAFDFLAAGDKLTVVYQVTLTDAHGASSRQPVTFVIIGTNDAPVVTGAVTAPATEDGASVTLNALSNASDPDAGATLSVINVGALPTGVSYNATTRQFTLNPANAIFQSLAQGETRIVTVSYQVSDGTVATNASVSWTVTGTNDAPIASAASGTVTEDAILTGQLVATDVDLGTTLTFTQIGIPVSGLTIAANGSYTMDASHPDYQALTLGQSRVVTATFSVSDGITSVDRTLSITVNGVNEPPVAVADTATTTENASISGNVLGNDMFTGSTGATGNILVNGSFENPAIANESYTYVAVPGWRSAAGTFELWGDGFLGNRASDGQNFVELDNGSLQDSYSQTLATTAGRTYYLAFDLAQRTGTAAASNQVEFLVNGRSLGIFTPPTTTFTTFNVQFVGTGSDVITFREPVSANDGVGGLIDNLRISAQADVFVTAVGGSAAGVGGAVAGSNGGSFTVAADGSYTFTPGAAFDYLAVGQTATTTVTYTMADNTGSSSSTLTVTVTGTNDAPVLVAALADASATAYTVRTIATAQAFADIDAGEALSYTATLVNGQPLPSYVTIDRATGVISVNAIQTQTGALTVHVTATDPHGAAISSDFALTINPLEVIGTAAGETLNGSANGETLIGNGGNDTINGGAGDDLIYGGGRGEMGPSPTTPSTLNAAQQRALTQGNILVNGLGGANGFGEFNLPKNDDGSTAAINISSVFGAQGLNFFGTNYTNLFINNNGNITFGASTFEYVPTPIQTSGLPAPIIAAFWTDIDTRFAGNMLSPGGTSTGANLVEWDLDTVNGIFTATWNDVGEYPTRNVPNAFQIQLINRGNGDFDIVYRYETINFDHGAARIGYSSNNGTAYEVAGSGTSAVLDFEIMAGNTGTVGLYVFQVRGGQVSVGDDDVINGGAGHDTLIGGAGNDVFVFAAGQADGDKVLDFNGFGGAQGDSLRFTGFGTLAEGATFVRLDDTHWQINSANGLLHETITFTNGASIDVTDFVFV